MPSRYRICVVCTGNICRSPMGEYLLRAALEQAGLDEEVVVDSAGTSSEEMGNPMDRRSARAMARAGLEDQGWGKHRARRFDPAWFADLDLILAADSGHQRTLQRWAPSEADAAKVRLLRSFDPSSIARDDLDMDDPWYGGDDGFDRTYAEIQSAIPGILDHVRAALGGDE